MGLFPKRPNKIFFLSYILTLIYSFKYEIIDRSSALSFGHLDPDPSSVNYKAVSLICTNKMLNKFSYCADAIQQHFDLRVNPSGRVKTLKPSTNAVDF